MTAAAVPEPAQPVAGPVPRAASAAVAILVSVGPTFTLA